MIKGQFEEMLSCLTSGCSEASLQSQLAGKNQVSGNTSPCFFPHSVQFEQHQEVLPFALVIQQEALAVSGKGKNMLGNHRAQWIVLLFPLLFFDRASPSCVQQNIRINGESETSLPTKSADQCEEECSRKRCPSWTWEGGQCQLKRRGKEGSKVGSREAVSGTEEAGHLFMFYCIPLP